MMALMVAGSLLSGIPSASARDDRVGSAGHSKMPEPLLTESITDLDGLDANEVELDGNAFGGRSAAAATVWQSSLEAEWRALERLGLALEVGLSGATGSPSSAVVSLQPAVSFVLVHDQPLDFHLMAEVTGRVGESREANEPIDLGEAAMPVSAGFRAGLRRSRLTIRGYLGSGMGEHSGHALPLRAQAAVLVEFGKDGRIGFAGIESDADWARRAPLTLSPDVVIRGAFLHLPVNIGVAIPWGVGARAGEPSFGILLRVTWELDAID